MKLTDQICTEPQADRLKELKVAQKSIAAYTASGTAVMGINDGWVYCTAAFTGSELGHILAGLDLQHSSYYMGGWESSIWDRVSHVYFTAQTEAQSRAACLIWLLETKPELLTVVNAIIED